MLHRPLWIWNHASIQPSLQFHQMILRCVQAVWKTNRNDLGNQGTSKGSALQFHMTRRLLHRECKETSERLPNDTACTLVSGPGLGAPAELLARDRLFLALTAQFIPSLRVQAVEVEEPQDKLSQAEIASGRSRARHHLLIAALEWWSGCTCKRVDSQVRSTSLADATAAFGRLPERLGPPA